MFNNGLDAFLNTNILVLDYPVSALLPKVKGSYCTHSLELFVQREAFSSVILACHNLTTSQSCIYS